MEIKIKTTRANAIKSLQDYIDKLRGLKDSTNILNALEETANYTSAIIYNRELIEKLRAKSKVISSNNSEIKATELAIRAKKDVIIYLEELKSQLEESLNHLYDGNITKEMGLIIIKRILENFYLHIKTMYKEPTHGKSGIKEDLLKEIVILNEYDVHRILLSIIKPIFPSVKSEVPQFTVNSSVRHDIIIEELSLSIEVKCTRGSMTEKKLEEEIASDIYHYHFENCFFFVYDKGDIIKNIDTFKRAYTKVIDKKEVYTEVIQPVKL